MRDLEAWVSQLPKVAGHGGSRAVRRLLQQGAGNLGVIHDSGWASPRPCNYYGMDAGTDCVPPHSAVVYLVTGVAGMALLLALTVFFICCLCFRKRRREQAEAAFLRWQEVQAVRPPMGTAFYPGVNPHPAVEVPMGPVAEGKNPSVCVIMAGEEKPTFLAHPVGGGSDLPTSEGPKEKEAEEAARRGSKSAS